jgi:biopolymer transport protein ExbD
MSALRLRRARTGEDADVDMTPMLDIVFIMLIFFIVTATFLDETGLDFTQPPDVPPTTIIETPSIAIYVDQNNQVSLDRRLTSLENVAAGVERLLADKPDANIILTADASASLNTVTRIKDTMDGMGRNTVIKVNKPLG